MMEGRRIELGRFRRVFGKASPLLKTVVSASIALSIAVLITLRLMQWEARADALELQRRAAQLEQENALLQEQIENLDTVESIRQIAMQELGLVDPGTVIFDSE